MVRTTKAAADARAAAAAGGAKKADATPATGSGAFDFPFTGSDDDEQQKQPALPRAGEPLNVDDIFGEDDEKSASEDDVPEKKRATRGKRKVGATSRFFALGIASFRGCVGTEVKKRSLSFIFPPLPAAKRACGQEDAALSLRDRRRCRRRGSHAPQPLLEHEEGASRDFSLFKLSSPQFSAGTRAARQMRPALLLCMPRAVEVRGEAQEGRGDRVGCSREAQGPPARARDRQGVHLQRFLRPAEAHGGVEGGAPEARSWRRQCVPLGKAKTMSHLLYPSTPCAEASFPPQCRHLTDRVVRTTASSASSPACAASSSPSAAGRSPAETIAQFKADIAPQSAAIHALREKIVRPPRPRGLSWFLAWPACSAEQPRTFLPRRRRPL